MKAVVAAFNQEKALLGAFSVITNLRMELFEAPAAIDGDQQLELGPAAAAGDGAGEQLQLYHPAGELQQPAIIAFKQPPVLCAHLALLHNRQENTTRIFAYSYIHSYS